MNQRLPANLFHLFLFACLCFFQCKKDQTAGDTNESSLHITPSPIDTFIQNEINRANEFSKNSQTQIAFSMLDNLIKKHPIMKDSLKGLIYHKYGVFHFRNFDFEKSQQYLDTAIQIRKTHTPNDYSSIAQSYYMRGMAGNQQNRTEQALNDFLDAIQYANYAGEHLRNSDLYHMKAAINYEALEDFKTAELFYKKALRLTNILRGEQSVEMIRLLNSLGVFHGQQGEHKTGIEYYQKALSILSEMNYDGKIFDIIDVRFNITSTLLHLKRFPEAREQLNEISTMIEAIKDTPYYIHYQTQCLNNFAYLEIQENRFDKAISFNQQLLILAKEQNPDGYSSELAQAYEGLGNIALKQHQYEKALFHHQKALKSLCFDFKPRHDYENPDVEAFLCMDKIVLTRIMEKKAACLFEQYKATQKTERLEKALQTYEELDLLIVKLRQRYRMAGSKYELIEKHIATYEKAALTALELYERTGDKSYLEIAYNFCSKNKAIVFLEGTHDDEVRFSKIPAEELRNESLLKQTYNDLESELIDLKSADADPDTIKQKEHQRLETATRYQQLIRRFEQDYPEYFQLKYKDDSTIPVDTIRKQLPEKTAIVEYFLGEERLIIFVISGQGLKYYNNPLPENLKDLVRKFQAISEAPEESEEPEADFEQFCVVSCGLYEILLEDPLFNLTKNQSIERLIIIPDQYLLQLSFDALLYENYEKPAESYKWYALEIPYLIRKYAISYAYSNALSHNNIYTKNQKPPTGKKFIGFGLEYDELTLEHIWGLPSFKVSEEAKSRMKGRLDSSVAEVKQIHEKIGGRVFINDKATLDTFVKHAGDYKVLHLAMHGYISQENAMNSALIFHRSSSSSEFLLKAMDIYNMEFSAEMAVLSACNTNTGPLEKGEGVKTLARAFQYAGCKSIIASLWSANDVATKEIMVRFYDYILEGYSKDVALQKAKIQYLNDINNFASMKLLSFWSHLVIIGDGSEISL